MSPDEYLPQALAAVIIGNEEMTVITDRENWRAPSFPAEFRNRKKRGLNEKPYDKAATTTDPNYHRFMPTTVVKRGFFSDEAEMTSQSIRAEHKQLFRYFKDELSLKVHQFRNGLQFVPGERRRILAAALLARALAAFEALVFLAERGFGSEVRASCRNIMDAMFRLAYLDYNPESALALVQISERFRKQILESIRDGLVPSLELFRDNLEELIAKAEANAGPGSYPSLKKIAETCGLQKEYCLYSYLSESNHAGVSELVNYISFDSNGEMNEYHYGPETAGDGLMTECCLQAAAYLLSCVQCTSRIFNFSNPSEAGNLTSRMEKRFQEMVQRYSNVEATREKLKIAGRACPPTSD